MFHFFAMLSRMKYIHRWGLMRNSRPENLCEHSYETAVLAHALCLLRNRRFGGHVNPERAAALALFHDCTEILTGDLPTPVKYGNKKIQSAYKEVEHDAAGRLLSLLPKELQGDYRTLFLQDAPGDEELRPLVKAADKLSALIKCTEETGTGSLEFSTAKETLLSSIHAMHLPEAEAFLEEFLPSYRLTLDELESPVEGHPQN